MWWRNVYSQRQTVPHCAVPHIAPWGLVGCEPENTLAPETRANAHRLKSRVSMVLGERACVPVTPCSSWFLSLSRCRKLTIIWTFLHEAVPFVFLGDPKLKRSSLHYPTRKGSPSGGPEQPCIQLRYGRGCCALVPPLFSVAQWKTVAFPSAVILCEIFSSLMFFLFCKGLGFSECLRLVHLSTDGPGCLLGYGAFRKTLVSIWCICGL